MKIMPAWISDQQEEGVICVPGSSQPKRGAVDVFIPSEDIESVVVLESSPIVNGRRFGIIVISKKGEGR